MTNRRGGGGRSDDGKVSVQWNQLRWRRSSEKGDQCIWESKPKGGGAARMVVSM